MSNIIIQTWNSLSSNQQQEWKATRFL